MVQSNDQSVAGALRQGVVSIHAARTSPRTIVIIALSLLAFICICAGIQSARMSSDTRSEQRHTKIIRDQDTLTNIKDMYKPLVHWQVDETRFTDRGLRKCIVKGAGEFADSDIGPLVEKYRTWRAFVFRDTDIKGEGLEKLGETPIEWLELEDTPLSDGGLEAIGKLHGLRHLSFDGCPDITPAGMKALTRLRNLNSLRLTYTQDADQFLRALVPIGSIEVLSLKGFPISQSTVNILSQMANLKQLDFKNVNLSPGAFDNLHNLKHLKLVGFFDQRKIDERTVDGLVATKLDGIRFKDSHLSREAVLKLAHAKGNPSISVVSTPVTEKTKDELIRLNPGIKIEFLDSLSQSTVDEHRH